MQDILPPETFLWQHLEAKARGIFSAFGFQEMRLPLLESTDVFIRSIGENTDIVEKEMYTFHDKAGRSITLRPEGTASVVRSFVENNLGTLPSPQKFYYTGPMFRYERPQSGRYRQFYQIGAEAFGSAHPRTDAEMLSMLRHIFTAIGMGDLTFEVNSIGCEACRPDFREALLGFLGDRVDSLCADCRRRYTVNPLRVLDCKVERCIEVRTGAPKVTEYLCRGCRDHFEAFLSFLGLLDIRFSVNTDMVRGLDYYTRTTFEVKSLSLGAQNAVAAGGRYDRLVKEFGGPDTPAVGFAMGIERIAELLRQKGEFPFPAPDLFLAVLGEDAGLRSAALADDLRSSGVWVETGEPGASLKSQMRKADRLQAGYVFILGDEEVRTGKVKWKRLSDSAQGELLLDDAASFFVRSRAGV